MLIQYIDRQLSPCIPVFMQGGDMPNTVMVSQNCPTNAAINVFLRLAKSQPKLISLDQFELPFRSA